MRLVCLVAVIAAASVGTFSAFGATSSQPVFWSVGMARVTVATQHGDSPLHWNCIGRGTGIGVRVTIDKKGVGDHVIGGYPVHWDLVFRQFTCTGPGAAGSVTIQAS